MVYLVIRTLLNCEPPGKCFPDGIAARLEPGIFNYAAGYLGVVEPQLRKALHLHMLVQLLGFAHPMDFFRSGRLIEVFRRCGACMSSVCFRSTEAFAAYTQEPGAIEALRAQPLLPVAQQQRGMIGEARMAAALEAQLHARGLSKPAQETSMAPLRFFASAALS